MARYGHLRPGTYDILSSRYDESPDLYFNWSNVESYDEVIEPFTVTLDQITKISEHLNLNNLQIDAVGLLNFIKNGIEFRELSKFHFTKIYQMH